MIVHLHSSVLVDALTGPRRSLPALERVVSRGHVIASSSLALYEWLRATLDAQSDRFSGPSRCGTVRGRLTAGRIIGPKAESRKPEA